MKQAGIHLPWDTEWLRQRLIRNNSARIYRTDFLIIRLVAKSVFTHTANALELLQRRLIKTKGKLIYIPVRWN